MSLMTRIRNAMAALRTEQRSISSVPWDRGDPLFSVASQERALTLVPVFAAVRLISDTIATLPVKGYRKAGDERVPMPTLPPLFNQMDLDGTLTDWLHRAVTSMALRGNAYGLVTARDGMQFPTAVEWLSPNDVFVDDTVTVAPVWYWRGRRVPTEDMLHIPWFTVPGKVLGLSPIEAYAMTVDVGLQAQQYGSTWFTSGGVPPGTFKNTARTLDPNQADAIKERLTLAIRSRKPIVYGSDWDYTAIAVPPEQAQFIQTQKLTATQIASIYGIPPEMIGGESGSSLTYATVEQNNLRLATLTLRPWLVQLERKFSAILPSRQYVKFNADAIVRSDLAGRYGSYAIAKQVGLLTIDEMRALEDRPPLTDAQKTELAPPPPPAPTAPPEQPPAVTREMVLKVLAEIVDADMVENRRAIESRRAA